MGYGELRYLRRKAEFMDWVSQNAMSQAARDEARRQSAAALDEWQFTYATLRQEADMDMYQEMHADRLEDGDYE